MSLNKTNQNRRWIFKNSVKLILKRLDKPISHKVLFNALDIVLNQVENDAITSIYNFSSNKVWIIEFNVVFDVAQIFDREININGTNFRLEDANKVPDLRRYCIFRFHFLPSDFENHRLETFFNAVRIDGLKIEHITEEKYRDRPERKNGVRRVRISFPKEVENIIGSLSGPTMMYGLKCLVSIVGQKQKCYFCDEEGHKIAKCPIKETLCEKCHQKGHLTQKCSIAEKLKSLERKKIDYNDLYIDQEETQSIIGADQKDNDDNMMPKTPEYQTTNFNDVISQISTQDLKTPVLEDTLVSRLNDFLPLCQSPVNERSNDQNENETFFQTKNQIKRFSESDANEKEFTEKESKKPLVVLENENDNTFESESNSSTIECSIQVDQSSNEDGQHTASQNSIEENLE
ncbi:hypothetical protein BpHYR1_001222 [Brachionus plicatilis]|uniref:CCHC-type domain-containing protein n=1 Tax=Brachionus plicatilis TaxID=10195 RepID=A0A3M7SUV9_BRAPC|nr:hypothetical protein BpHYR1_001222 [Brachionus plicatilis]